MRAPPTWVGAWWARGLCKAELYVSPDRDRRARVRLLPWKHPDNKRTKQQHKCNNNNNSELSPLRRNFLGGLEFFCTTLMLPEGDAELLLMAMTAMNAAPDPDNSEVHMQLLYHTIHTAADGDDGDVLGARPGHFGDTPRLYYTTLLYYTLYHTAILLDYFAFPILQFVY